MKGCHPHIILFQIRLAALMGINCRFSWTRIMRSKQLGMAMLDEFLIRRSLCTYKQKSWTNTIILELLKKEGLQVWTFSRTYTDRRQVIKGAGNGTKSPAYVFAAFLVNNYINVSWTFEYVFKFWSPSFNQSKICQELFAWARRRVNDTTLWATNRYGSFAAWEKKAIPTCLTDKRHRKNCRGALV